MKEKEKESTMDKSTPPTTVCTYTNYNGNDYLNVTLTFTGFQTGEMVYLQLNPSGGGKPQSIAINPFQPPILKIRPVGGSSFTISEYYTDVNGIEYPLSPDQSSVAFSSSGVAPQVLFGRTNPAQRGVSTDIYESPN